jgi:tRNA-dihydrouridine synthase C
MDAVIANGEIWNLEDYRRCRERSGCDDVMIGRGLLACPDLARQIKAHLGGEDYQPMTWAEVCALLHRYYRESLLLYPAKYGGNRIKQWLMYLRRQYPQAEGFFEHIKREHTPAAFEQAFLRAA